MKKILAWFFVFAASLSVASGSENIQGHIGFIKMLDAGSSNPILMQGQACDLNSGCTTTGHNLTIQICWDDPTCTIASHDVSVMANVGDHYFNYFIAPLAGVNPNDGNRHFATVRALSVVGGAPKILDGSPWPYKLITAFAGTAKAGTTTSITLPSGTSSTTNAYLNYTLVIRGGSGAGQSAHISAYNGSTKVASFAKTLGVTPNSTSVVTIEAIGPMWDLTPSSGSTRLLPSQLAVFVNAADTYSIGSTGTTYCTDPGTGLAIKDDGVAGWYGNLYGIPCANFYLLNGRTGLSVEAAPNVPTGLTTQAISQANFNSQIAPTIKALPSTIQAVALAFGNPVEVVGANGYNSVAGMVANGGVFTAGVNVPIGATSCNGYLQNQKANPYFNTGTATPFTTYGIRPAMMLVGETYGSNDPRFGPYTFSAANFKTMTAASHASIDSNPSGGKVYVSITADYVRSAIADVFSPASQGAGLAPNANGAINGNIVSPFTYALQGTNILGYVVADLTTTIGAPFSVLPGGSPLIFEMTSTSGMLPYDGGQQPAAWALNYAGAAGSYGSVTEPCVTYPIQFPDPALWAANYVQGQTMIESIWKSVKYTALATPIGDPLAAPFPLHSVAANCCSVLDVTSSTANGTYSTGDSISIQVIFNGTVTVTGIPQLALDSGGTATYSSGSGTDTLTFTYSVSAGQNSGHLDYASANALSLNGGTIAGPGGAKVNLTLSAPGTAGSLSAATNIIVDTVPVNVTIQTNPPGLQFSVNGGALQTAPQGLNLAQGSHVIAVAATQNGPAGVQYAFSGWSDGGAASHSITVGSGAVTYTASFNTQYQLTVSASPAAGGTVTPASSGFYASGTAVAIDANPNSGYSFAGWTGGVAGPTSASTTVTMSGREKVTANFSSLTGITVQTSPPGLQFSVDGGALQITPQVVNVSQGAHVIAVAATQTGPGGARYAFVDWSDGGAASHSITVGSSAATYTATFEKLH